MMIVNRIPSEDETQIKASYFFTGQLLIHFLSTKVELLSPQAGGLPTTVDPLSNGAESLSPQAKSLSPQVEIPTQLQEKLDVIGQRIADRSELEEVIVELCELREFTSKQVASIIAREEKYLKKNYLKKLLKEGRIQNIIPEMISYPHQKYKAIKIL